MDYTSDHLDFKFPVLGSTGQWGATLNANFSLVSQYMTKLSSELAATKLLLGAGIPYYKELYDNNGKGPYKFVEITAEGNRFKSANYYTSITKDASTGVISGLDNKSEDKYVYPVQDLNELSTGIGAYVIKEVTIDSVTYQPGDLIVVLQRVGSILDPTYGSMYLQKYPETGFYIEPLIDIVGAGKNRHVQIDYKKSTFVDYVTRPIVKSYAAIPAYHYVTESLTDGTTAFYSFENNEVDTDDLSVSVQIYKTNKNNELIVPVYCNYTINKSYNDNNSKHEIEVYVPQEVQTYIKTYEKDYELKCDICIGYNIQEQLTEKT